MGGFGSRRWADVVTRKDNTSLCRTISAKQLKDLGLEDRCGCGAWGDTDSAKNIDILLVFERTDVWPRGLILQFSA